MKRKWYEWMLTIVYFAMVALCVFLNFTPGHEESLTTKIVNIVMFAIVAIVFLLADFGCFAPINSVIKDLNRATEKIHGDAMNSHTFLWEPYSQGSIELFKTRRLKECLRDYIFELNRESDAENVYYKPGIDDYINEKLVDSIIHRNELNQVAGMLTGLGILGTFIGLSLGLQNFNTGTTAQMTESIEPLMNGIKVAFHTSIYGMVFSLTFNTIYKRKLYEADEAVSSFVTAFKKFVLPDTTNNGMNQLLQMQCEQIDAINVLAETISENLYDMIVPQLESFNDTINNFANVATRNQTEAIRDVVEHFIAQMNNSLGGSFTRINETVNEQYQIQKQNSAYMESLATYTKRSAEDTKNVLMQMTTAISEMQRIIEAITEEADYGEE